jgi:hypothetical protein
MYILHKICLNKRTGHSFELEHSESHKTVGEFINAFIDCVKHHTGVNVTANDIAQICRGGDVDIETNCFIYTFAVTLPKEEPKTEPTKKFYVTMDFTGRITIPVEAANAEAAKELAEYEFEDVDLSKADYIESDAVYCEDDNDNHTDY